MTLRWGICCVGRIASDFCSALRLEPTQHQVVAVAARELARAQSFALIHGSTGVATRCYEQYDELAKDNEVDVIYVASLHPQHRDLVMMFLKAKKAVLCEKPMGMSVAETREMLEAAQENEVFFMEAVWSRFNPIYTTLRNECYESLGEPRLVHANFTADSSRSRRTFDKDLGGSATLDIGIYVLNFAQWIFRGEKPESVNAIGGFWSEDHKKRVDQWANVTLRYSGGRVAELNFHNGIDGCKTADVSGTKGFAQLSAPFWAPEELWVNGKLVKRALAVPEEHQSKNLNFVYGNSGFLIHEAEEVRKCLQQKKTQSDIMSHADSLQLAELMAEVIRQLEA